ncbi:hypothetical protein ACH42_12900 [Endozoicomonas sp. (ex Bugula neritina AB1)]|nr:hypothetical protein ACH42_12900 [Endozoicomonas sp. (ex Bugula neritina AB1)]
MEYQFCRDLIGKPEACFSMDHEAVGNWLIIELGTLPDKITPLIAIVNALINNERWEYSMEGQEFDLKLTRDQAEVRASLLSTNMDCEEMEDMDYYDDESISHCGLDDFKTMLESWLEFISP